MYNPTDLESLLVELNEFKKEMFLFIGDANEYNNIYNKKDIEKRLKWLSETLGEINSNLKSQGIQLDIFGLVEYDSYGYSINYKPSFILKTDHLSISYKTGFFSDKFKVFSLEKDLIQLQPKLKVKKTLNDTEFQAVSQLLQTGIAEVAQHRFEEFQMQLSQHTKIMTEKSDDIIFDNTVDHSVHKAKKSTRLNYEL